MGAILVRNFDYDTLAPDIASMAAAAAAEIRTSTRRQITEVIAAGKLLLEVKAALPHGAFGKWLEAEFGWTERTAQNYMRAAETYGIKYEMRFRICLSRRFTSCRRPPFQSPSGPTSSAWPKGASVRPKWWSRP